MTRFPIATAEDVADISRRPYEKFMPYRSVHEALQATASRHPDRVAMNFIESADLATPPRTWTYPEFVAGVRRAANLFKSLAGSDEPRVAMLLPAIPEAHFVLWGAETAGVVCPINYLLNTEHIAELIDAAGINILVALGPDPDLDIASRIPDLQARCAGLRHVVLVGDPGGERDFTAMSASMRGDALDFALPSDANRLAALFHTGGTTGAPKLAQHTHGNQLHAAWGAAQMYGMDEQDTILNGFPLFHVAGAFVYGLSALLSGAQLVLPTRLGLRNAAFVQRYWSFVERHRVSLLAAVPTVIATLLNTDPSGADLRSVRALLTGGSPLPTELAGAFEQRFAIPVRNILGMTECAGVVSIEPFRGPRTPGSCGLPLPYTEVHAFHDDGSLCKPDETGILRLRGPNVGPGYTDPRRNAGTFTVDGWLISGDIGHVDAKGRVFITGRAKDLIIRSSHNIDPQAIEEALLTHPAVQIAAAVGEPDEYAGESPVVFVSLRPGITASVEELHEHAQRTIHERPALPKRIEIVDSLPMTAIGKLYKPALRARACERVMRDRIEQAGLGSLVQVKVDDAAGGLTVHFQALPGADNEALHDRIAALMQGFALRYRLNAPEPAPVSAGEMPR